MMEYMDELKHELASLMWDQLYPQKVKLVTKLHIIITYYSIYARSKTRSQLDRLAGNYYCCLCSALSPTFF